jgi:hypothetical protein
MVVYFDRPTETGVGDSSWPLLAYQVVATPDMCPGIVEQIRIQVSGTNQSALVRGLAKGCVYVVSVRAQNNVGLGEEAVAADKLLALVPSSKPAPFSALPGISQQVTESNMNCVSISTLKHLF